MGQCAHGFMHPGAHLTARSPAIAACMEARWLSAPRISGAADRWHSISRRSLSQTSLKAAHHKGSEGSEASEGEGSHTPGPPRGCGWGW